MMLPNILYPSFLFLFILAGSVMSILSESFSSRQQMRIKWPLYGPSIFFVIGGTRTLQQNINSFSYKHFPKLFKTESLSVKFNSCGSSC